MLEINIRVYFQKKETGLFPDYHGQIKMLETDLAGKAEASVDSSDDLPVCQYYTVSPLAYMEARQMRRMHAGKSVICVKEGICQYVRDCGESWCLPRAVRSLMYRYLKGYLNSLDYIVVQDQAVEEELRQEGVDKPQFYLICPEERDGRRLAQQWLDFYRMLEAA